MSTENNLPADAPLWAVALNANVLRVESKLDTVKEIHEKILDVVNEVKPEVMSVIDGLSKNPMFKMLTGGKK